MRRLAIKWDPVVVDSDGRVGGHDAGATLVRRLLRLRADPILIGPGPRRGDGFEVMPLEFVDTDSTVVINMDVLDSTRCGGAAREWRASCGDELPVGSHHHLRRSGAAAGRGAQLRHLPDFRQLRTDGLRGPREP